MKRGIFTLLLLTGFMTTATAQPYDTVTIKEIQQVSQNKLASCTDASPYAGDTVWVRGTVVMDGDRSAETDDNSANAWLQDGSGPYSGLDIYDLSPGETNGVKVENLNQGDSVLIRGGIEEFQGESEIVPNLITIISSNQDVSITEGVTIADLNNGNQINKLESGEKWEGTYAQITDARVVSVDFFAGGDRVSFIVQDDQGNQMNVSDRFQAQRLPSNGGDFQAPPIGTNIDTLRGVIAHSKNGCPGTDGRGYELFPFKESHYRYGNAPPIISDVQVDPEFPTSNDQVTISANIEELNTSVQEAYLHYATGENGTFDSVRMNNPSANTYEADIPSGLSVNDGTLVKYYISATDNDDPQQRNAAPNVPNNSAPAYYRVRDNGLTIFDLQYAPFAGEPYFEEASGYQDQSVTVSGVVTATAQSGDLGYVYIQQRGRDKWAGIQLTGNSKLSQAQRGAVLEVTGTVQESFGFTRLGNVSSVSQVGTTDDIPSVTVQPGVFTSYSQTRNEAYEGMLVTLNVPNDKLYVVDTNADYSPDNPQNFAEYRVGPDTTKPDSGSRVIAGRQSGTSASSLNVSYVNDDQWELEDGIMNVDPKVIQKGEYMDSLRGIMYYSFSNMKLLPRNNDDFYNYSDPVVLDTTAEDTTGLNTTTKAPEVRVYPNPATDQLNVKLSNQEGQRYRVQLTSMKGRVVRQRRIAGSNSVPFSVADLKAGVYALTVMSESGSLLQYRKVMVNK